MGSPKAAPRLLAHVQRGRMPSLASEPKRQERRVHRPRPVLDEAVFDVPLDLIVADSPVQTREPFDPEASDEDAALVEVVRRGLWVSPVVLCATTEPTSDRVTTYQIEDGHRRVAAHRLVGRVTVRAVITRHDGREADLATLRANTFKRLPPVQQAQAIARIHERHGLEYQTIAEFAGLTPRYVSELMRMLDAGDGALQAVEEGRLSVREAARIGRTVDRRAGSVEEPAAALITATESRAVEEHESATGRSDDSALASDIPMVTSTINAARRSFLEDEVNALSWLAPEQRARLVEWTREHPMRLRQVLAVAVLLSANPSPAMEDAASAAEEFLRRRVGYGIVQIVEMGLRMRRAVEAGQTSREERDLLRVAAHWLLEPCCDT